MTAPVSDTAIETATDGSTDAATAAADGAHTETAADSVMPDSVPDASPVAAAENLKEVVVSESRTLGGIVELLDGYSIDIGSFHLSLWSALLVLLVIAGVYFVARLGSKIAHWILGRATRLDTTQKLLAEKLITMFVWALAILIGIDLLGIDLTALAVFSGALGLAIGFGLQKTFGNLIAGIILLMDRSIKPGDVIAVTDMAGNETFGQIRKIGIRAVSIVTRDQKEYLIPNENLMINQVENWSYSSRQVRMQVPVGVSYLSDMAKAEELMLEAAKACPRVLESPPPTVWMSGYGDSSVDFIIHCWITDPEEGIGNVRSQVLKKLWWLFKEHEIEIPYPQRDLNLRDSEQFQQLVSAIALRDDKGT